MKSYIRIYARKKLSDNMSPTNMYQSPNRSMTNNGLKYESEDVVTNNHSAGQEIIDATSINSPPFNESISNAKTNNVSGEQELAHSTGIKFTLEQLHKIFKKEQALNALKEFNPELFGKKTQRSKNITYIGKDLYIDIQQINTKTLIEYIRDFSISNEEGKYKAINDDPDYYKNLIKSTNIKKEDSPCHPEQFSESVVKRNTRKAINTKSHDIVNEIVNMCREDFHNHVKERTNQQVKADYTEWLMIKHNQNIIPTLKHSKGTDMFLLTPTRIEDLDIKTTRSIWGITDPKEAITKLYQKQGQDRFSSDPRLYIYLSDNDAINEEKINTQLETTYEITFEYKKETYNVIGARLVII